MTVQLALATGTTTTVRIERDYDGLWCSRWHPDIVAAGRSPGAGRHQTRQALIDAIEARGWQLTCDVDGLWTATEVAA